MLEGCALKLQVLCNQLQEPCTGLHSGMHNMVVLSIVTHISDIAYTEAYHRQAAQRSKRGQRPHLLVIIIAIRCRSLAQGYTVACITW